jgi:hypothetical protein
MHFILCRVRPPNFGGQQHPWSRISLPFRRLARPSVIPAPKHALPFFVFIDRQPLSPNDSLQTAFIRKSLGANESNFGN